MNGVEFTYASENMDQGFPGNLSAKATYLVSNEDELVMTWEAILEGEPNLSTPVNLCNHAYWNISGDFAMPTIGDHFLQISANEILQFDKT